jgi:hypothetical protein
MIFNGTWPTPPPLTHKHTQYEAGGSHIRAITSNNYKLWWIISDLQFLGDWWRPLLSFWCPCNHEAKDRCKGRKESLGKETDALDPDKHFDVILLLCWGHRLRVMWGVWGHVALKIMWRAPEIFLQYVTPGDFVLSSCHYLISEISSIRSPNNCR